MERKLIYNAIRTPDGTLLVSRHTHDYVSHIDKNGEEYFLDGGMGHIRTSINIISYEQEFRPNNPYLKTYLAEKEFRQKNKPPLEYYLICVGRSLSNYSYDPISILNNTVYFIDSYNKNISVKDSLDNFSKYNG
jgi:hypothetical protein|nr:MAG TPA: hypothetical protein [Caudoviricetes sp.]